MTFGRKVSVSDVLENIPMNPFGSLVSEEKLQLVPADVQANFVLVRDRLQLLQLCPWPLSFLLSNFSVPM